jgi:hypothetical protein
MENKIFLGRVKHEADNMLAGENVYLTKHSWDCGWYWGMGYIGNSRSHTHFDSTFLKDTKTASELFINPQFTDSEWWVIRDLMIQAYALQKAAEVYRYGGHQKSHIGITDIIKNDTMVKLINADCGKVLNTLWAYVTRDRNSIKDCLKDIQALNHKKNTIKDSLTSQIKEIDNMIDVREATLKQLLQE